MEVSLRPSGGLLEMESLQPLVPELWSDVFFPSLTPGTQKAQKPAQQ